MLSQTLLDTHVAEHVAPMMNVLTDIHTGMQSLNLEHLMVQQKKGPGGKMKNGKKDKKGSKKAMAKKCTENPYPSKCILNNYSIFDDDNEAELWYMLMTMWDNYAWNALFGPWLVASSIYLSLIVLLFPDSYPTI